MNREALIEKIAEAMDNIHDYDTPFEAYAKAALTAITEAGMVVVPREPTGKPREAAILEIQNRYAAHDGFCGENTAWGIFSPAYKAMLAAADKGE